MYNVVIIAFAKVILNPLLHPFKCAPVNSILMSIINTKVGVTAYTVLSLELFVESDNLHEAKY